MTNFLWHFNIVQDRNTYVTITTRLQTEIKCQVHHIHVFIFKVKQTVPVRYNQNGGRLENEIKMD